MRDNESKKSALRPASFHSAITLLFIYLTLSCGVSFAGSTIPQLDEMRRARPPGAPLLEIPAHAVIRNTIQSKGVARVIVRLAAPAPLPGGFISETDLKESEAIAQRSRIRGLQNTVLSRVMINRAATAKRYGFIPFMALEVDQVDLQALVASPEIDFIEEDIAVPPLLAQSIPLIGGVNGSFNGYAGSGQAVAILDTGVKKTHPFLSGKVTAEGCYSTSGASSTAYCTSGSTAPGSGLPCPDTATGCWHGTHVAGIAAGNNGPSYAPSGVARDAEIIAIQVFSRFSGTDDCGSDTTCPRAYESDLISALEHVYDLGSTRSIASVNMSLGGGQYFSNCDSSFPSLKAAVDNLRSAGIATVISAGNDGYTNSIGFPACISTAVSVGATDEPDVVASYSNSASFLSLLATGSSITSSYPDTGYATASGTSMAAPHVAGAWAVLKSAKPAGTVTEILIALTSTGKPILDSRNGITKPRIQLTQAVYALPFTISDSVVNGVGGTITSSGSTVLYGESVTFTITPDQGYALTSLTDNDVDVSAVEEPAGTFTYSISNVTANHAVNATFAIAAAPAVPAMPPFGFSAGFLMAAAFGYGRLSGKRKITTKIDFTVPQSREKEKDGCRF